MPNSSPVSFEKLVFSRETSVLSSALLAIGLLAEDQILRSVWNGIYGDLPLHKRRHHGKSDLKRLANVDYFRSFKFPILWPPIAEGRPLYDSRLGQANFRALSSALKDRDIKTGLRCKRIYTYGSNLGHLRENTVLESAGPRDLGWEKNQEVLQHLIAEQHYAQSLSEQELLTKEEVHDHLRNSLASAHVSLAELYVRTNNPKIRWAVTTIDLFTRQVPVAVQEDGTAFVFHVLARGMSVDELEKLHSELHALWKRSPDFKSSPHCSYQLH